jgi:hypothetical protein
MNVWTANLGFAPKDSPIVDLLYGSQRLIVNPPRVNFMNHIRGVLCNVADNPVGFLMLCEVYLNAKTTDRIVQIREATKFDEISCDFVLKTQDGTTACIVKLMDLRNWKPGGDMRFGKYSGIRLHPDPPSLKDNIPLCYELNPTRMAFHELNHTRFALMTAESDISTIYSPIADFVANELPISDPHNGSFHTPILMRNPTQKDVPCKRIMGDFGELQRAEEIQLIGITIGSSDKKVSNPSFGGIAGFGDAENETVMDPITEAAFVMHEETNNDVIRYPYKLFAPEPPLGDIVELNFFELSRRGDTLWFEQSTSRDLVVKWVTNNNYPLFHAANCRAEQIRQKLMAVSDKLKQDGCTSGGEHDMVASVLSSFNAHVYKNGGIRRSS